MMTAKNDYVFYDIDDGLGGYHIFHRSDVHSIIPKPIPYLYYWLLDRVNCLIRQNVEQDIPTTGSNLWSPFGANSLSGICLFRL